MDFASLVAAALSLFAGGAVKGVAGLGLPLVALPLLTTFVSLKTAVGLLVVPAIASNLVQSFQGGRIGSMLKRFWPVIVTLVATIAISTNALVLVPEKILYAIIGAAVIGFPLLAHFRPALRIRSGPERWLGPVIGVIAGFVGGVSSFFGPPLMVYVAGLRLAKDDFVPAISLLYFMGSVGLGLGLFSFRIMDAGDFGLSALACLPVFLGLWLGQRVRARLHQQRFDRILLAVYLATGASFLLRALG